MSTKKNIFISCDEANHTCDKSQYKEATFWEKIKLNIHLIYCRACRKYTKNNTKLSKLVNNQDVDCMNLDEKARMKESFQKELSKQQ